MSKISILGLSGSLRNARFRRGSLSLANEIEGIETEKELTAYLAQQTKIRADDFLEAGLSKGAPFDEVYRALQRRRFERGLSNSEAATATPHPAAAESHTSSPSSFARASTIFSSWPARISSAARATACS